MLMSIRLHLILNINLSCLRRINGLWSQLMSLIEVFSHEYIRVSKDSEKLNHPKATQ